MQICNWTGVSVYSYDGNSKYVFFQNLHEDMVKFMNSNKNNILERLLSKLAGITSMGFSSMEKKYVNIVYWILYVFECERRHIVD